MKPLRTVEFTLSALAVIASAGIWILAVSSKNPLAWSSLEWAFMFLILTIFPVVGLIGSYGHAFLNREIGFYFQCGASFAMLAAIASLFVMLRVTGGITYGADLVLLLPPVLALFAVVMAACVRYMETQDRLTIDGTLDGLP
jgi:hypothetical protein